MEREETSGHAQMFSAGCCTQFHRYRNPTFPPVCFRISRPSTFVPVSSHSSLMHTPGSQQLRGHERDNDCKMFVCYVLTRLFLCVAIFTLWVEGGGISQICRARPGASTWEEAGDRQRQHPGGIRTASVLCDMDVDDFIICQFLYFSLSKDN